MTPKERAANYMKLKKGYKMKQTAVEWLVEKLDQKFDYVADTLIEQAKEIEKQQIIDAWVADNNELQRIAAEQYYNKTYKK